MARFVDALPENSPGDFFVDGSCIDCGTCFRLAPSVFAESDRAQSHVQRQPQDEATRCRALMALVACPTSSIGTKNKTGAGNAARAFPEQVWGDVYYCGYASADSYGASSYLIRRPEGNVLIDSPRAARPLLERLTELGGVHQMFLTHRDDVADYKIFREHFGCGRVMHRADIGPDTAGVERQLEGVEPVQLASDLIAIPVPGHTRGSMALLQGDVLFSGDHLWSEGGKLAASRSVCWYSWAEQVRSFERLLAFRFTHVLPGHGDPHRTSTATQMREELETLWKKARKAA